MERSPQSTKSFHGMGDCAANRFRSRGRPMTSSHPRLRFTRLPALDLEMLHASGITHDYPPHLHEEFSIAVMLRGTEVITFGARQFVATAGSVILINAEDVHANRSAGSEYVSMKVRPEVLRSIAADITGRETTVSFRDAVVDGPALFAELRNLVQTLAGQPSTFEVESAFVAAMGSVLTRHGDLPAVPFRKKRRAILAVRDYLKNHFASDVSLAELTAIAQLSRFHLLRLFRHQTGVPPHEYQLQLRVAQARKLMRRGQAISEAALATGFCDQSHLSRSFKRITGMTPGQYIVYSKIVQDRMDDV